MDALLLMPTMPNPRTTPPRLSAELEALHARTKGQWLTLRELKQALHARSAPLLLILLALPFCVIAIPGLSMPFGLAICLMGGCWTAGREARLPGFVLDKRLPPKQVAKLLRGAARVVRRLETVVRPRLAFLHAAPGMARLAGLGLMVAGLALMLPLPIPFSNAIPAWAVVFLALGRMEEDGLCVLFGHLTAIGSWVFIGLTGAVGVQGLSKLWEIF
jgi:hypothetical protein